MAKELVIKTALGDVKLALKNLMQAYNLAVWSCRRKEHSRFDEARIRRALSILMKNELLDKQIKYGTYFYVDAQGNHYGCMCPDHYHGFPVCKHQLALMLIWRAQNPIPQDILDDNRRIRQWKKKETLVCS